MSFEPRAMYIYKQYDKAALDRQYNNRLQVPGFATHLQRCEIDSRQTEKDFPSIKDISYGDLERERLDIYSSGKSNSKTLVFIHGGYWQRLDKSDFQFVARAFLPAGINTVLITYPLAPAVSIDQIVLSCRRAFQWVYKNISRYNGDPDQLYLAGHSAGGHLVSMLMTIQWKQFDPSIPHDVIKGAAALSGLFNLIPILLSEVNEGVKLDKETALRNSAVQLEPAHACPLLLAVGGDESMEFKDQSKELYISWKDKGVPVTLLELPGINHYSIVETFAETPSSLYSAMLQLMK